MKLNCNKIKVGCFMFVGCLLSTIIPVTGVDSATVKVKSVSVEEPYAKSVSVAKGKTVQVSASVSVTPNKAKNKKVLYKSKNKKIATISKKGIIKGIKVGKTKVLIISKQNKKKKATIPVQVVKKAITKVTINKKTAKLNVGETVALAAAVQPTKQVSKTVEWSSSNKKIATVTKKGVVKAVSIGTTTIKATSLDGSKKSATCKVTVADTEVLTNIVDVVALSSDQLLVTLDCAAELKRSDVKLYMKNIAGGSYLREFSVKGLQTTDKIHYIVIVNDRVDYFSDGQYVKVLIPSLNGIKEKELLISIDRGAAGTDESIIEGIVGEYVSELIDFSTWKMGQSSYDVSGLPAGLSAQVIGNNLIIKGTPTSILDNVVAKVTATDELGNVITRDIRFLIGSTERIVAHIPPITRLSENSTNIGEYVRAVGGSGEYSYEVSGDNSGKVSVDYGVIKCDGSIGRYTDEDGKAEYKYAVNPVGSFAYEILIRDKRISELSCTTKSTVTTIPTSTVIGYVYDASGQPIEGVYVNAFCTTNNKIGHNKSPFATDSTGKYTIKVAQNEMYTFFTKVGAKYRVNTTNAQMSCNINSAMYKVSVEMGLEGVDTICQYMSQTKEKKIESIIQYDSYEEQLYESINNVLYMLPGIYEMTATEVLAYKDGEEVGRYDIELDFVVTNMPLSVKAKLTKIKEYELISNQPLSLVLEPKEIAYIKIVPTKTATYTINSALILGLYYFDNSPSYVSGMLSIREYYSEGEVVRYKIENKECSSLSINNIILTQVAEEDIITD